jgi:hypothetical protein
VRPESFSGFGIGARGARSAEKVRALLRFATKSGRSRASFFQAVDTAVFDPSACSAAMQRKHAIARVADSIARETAFFPSFFYVAKNPRAPTRACTRRHRCDRRSRPAAGREKYFCKVVDI